MTIPIVNGVNPLQTTLLELGIVSIRVALLLRCAEIQPVFGRFVRMVYPFTPFPLAVICYRVGCVLHEGSSDRAQCCYIATGWVPSPQR